MKKKPVVIKLKSGSTILFNATPSKNNVLGISPPPPLEPDEDDPPVRETMNVRIDIYDDFSLAEWVEMPGKCGTGDSPAAAIEEMLEHLAYDYKYTARLPDKQCAPDLIAAKPLMRKFFEGLPKKEKKP
jgi:hypothetical protein